MSEGFSYFTMFLLCVCFLIKCRHLLALFFWNGHLEMDVFLTNSGVNLHHAKSMGNL